MTDNTQTDCVAISVRLLDDAYLAWFSAESECEHTLRAWFAAHGEQRATAYLAYAAALDHEETAARDLERLWRLAEPLRETFVRGAQTVVE